MDRSAALAVVEREAARILAVAAGADVSSRVPSCPDWSLADLLDHLGRVYAMVATVLEGAPDRPPDRDRIPRRPEEQAPADWLTERLGILLPLLRDVDEDALRWNFVNGGSSPVGFWWRRQAHETLIHRVDAEFAAGVDVVAPEPEVAADGLEDLLVVTGLRPVAWDEIRLGEGLSVHLHATDAGGAEWTVDVENGTYAAAHLKADVAVRGMAWALDRWCWRRDTDHGAELEIFGDPAAAESWRPAV